MKETEKFKLIVEGLNIIRQQKLEALGRSAVHGAEQINKHDLDSAYRISNTERLAQELTKDVEFIRDLNAIIKDFRAQWNAAYEVERTTQEG